MGQITSAATALTFVVPVAFVTTVPAQAVTGTLSPQVGWWAPVIAAALFLASRWLWRRALASYTSASS